MAISTTDTSVRYSGTGSTGPFPIPFPFLDVSHIYASIAPTADGTPVLLSQGEYTVTQNADGSGGSITTTAAVPAPKVLVIFRSVPLTQPTVFQAAGPFPAKANETALDRLCMQVQQLANAIAHLGGGGSGGTGGTGIDAPSAGTLTWADATARGLAQPLFAGQLGVERGTQTVWIAQSTAVGDWKEFNPRFKNKLVIGYVADAGNPGEQQSNAAALLEAWDVDAAIFAGDNSYNPPGGMYGGVHNFDHDWAAFDFLIEAGKAFPALGNHELDYDGWDVRLADKFPYIANQNGGRYYKVTLGGGLVDLFVLDSGLDSTLTLIEPSGNSDTSAQHAWFVSALASSQSRWKIAMFHHPPITLNPGDDRAAPAMGWKELAAMDLICCGHTHLLELLDWNDTMLANFSAIAHNDGAAAGLLNGAPSITDRALWAMDGVYGLGRIVATQDRLEVEAWRTDGALLHCREVNDFSKRSLVEEHWQSISEDTTVGAGPAIIVARLPAPSLIRRLVIFFAQGGGEDLPFEIWAASTKIAEGTIPHDTPSISIGCAAPNTIIPAGVEITFRPSVPSTAKGLGLFIFSDRYN